MSKVLEQEYVRNGLSLDMLREKGDMLTKRVIQLKAEVAGKLEYFQGCQWDSTNNNCRVYIILSF